MESSSQTLESLPSKMGAVWRPENLPHTQLPLCEEVGLKHGRIHEVQGLSSDGFALSIIAKTEKVAVWIGKREDIYSLSPLAIRRYFCPSRLTCALCLDRKESLWAAEKALRSDGFETVVLQLRNGPDLLFIDQLKQSVAQKASMKLASSFSRIGTDKFEWQRRMEP